MLIEGKRQSATISYRRYRALRVTSQLPAPPFLDSFRIAGIRSVGNARAYGICTGLVEFL